jgi:Cdc6-like AAA superfamily ATPase
MCAQSGETVEYVLPAIFDEAWDVIQGEAYFHETKIKKHLGKDFIKLIIDGASGSGKTRIGLELYKKLEAEKHSLGLRRVHYVYVDCSDLQPQDRDIFAFSCANLALNKALTKSRNPCVRTLSASCWAWLKPSAV